MFKHFFVVKDYSLCYKSALFLVVTYGKNYFN